MPGLLDAQRFSREARREVLEILDAYVTTDTGIEVVSGVTLRVPRGSVYALMGPNGAGKSSLALAVMGHRGYRLKGRVLLDSEDVTGLETHERALRGLALAMQNPPEVEGVRVGEVLARVVERFWGASPAEARSLLVELLELVGLPPSMLERELMVGMSGGERKRLELVRVLAQRPKAVVLDEPDSGVDVESVPLIARAVEWLRRGGAAVILITHQPTLFRYIKPDKVLVMIRGRVVAEGGLELVETIVEKGYSYFEREPARGKGP